LAELCSVLLLLRGVVRAQDSPGSAVPAGTEDSPPTSVFSHPESSRFWVSGQINTIGQGHPSFRSPYRGPNSLRPTAELDVSNVMTLYTGYSLNPTTDVVLDVESAGGRGISSALGLAGFTDLDVVRSPDLGWTPYLARFLIHKAFALGGGQRESERGPLNMQAQLPARRLDVRLGKFSLVDFFDVNAVGSDSHLQFMNWTVDNNGAYDYAANTRGYTWGGLVEFQDRRWAIRFAEAMMPKVANGENLDANLARAHSENLEFEFHPRILPRQQGTVRLLSYVNHADMGKYRAAIDAFLAGLQPRPDITATRRQGRVKYGFGVNLEQPISDRWRAFARWGWNDGRNESFAYTECDRTIAFGSDLRGDGWHRRADKAGAAFVSNGLSGDHRRYLALGGSGFLLGDGKLNYGRETIVEAYYTAHLWRGFFLSPDLQHIHNPGYNKDRGPVLVYALRLHIDL
jgi:high affinity Mn2+ porin